MNRSDTHEVSTCLSITQYYVGFCMKFVYEILPFLQLCQMWMMWITFRCVTLKVLKLLHVARPLLSPPLLTLQLLMPTEMSSTVWLTSHAILNPTSVRHNTAFTGLAAHVFISSSSPIQLLCSSQIRTDQWEDQESVPHVEGAKGVSQS